jgi:hypothetical protein
MPDTLGETQPATLDPASRPPVVRWASVVLLLVWSAVEATVFAFALRPTASELLSDFTGLTVNPIVLVALLGIVLTIIIAGSFGSIQALNDAIQAKNIGNILSNAAAQLALAMFQVLFLYRGLVDALAPWLAQQGVFMGVAATYCLAFFAWVGVRGMTWFLFARSGAPALLAVLNRQAGRSTTQI